MDLRKIRYERWTGFIWLKIEPMVGSHVHGNESMGIMKRQGIS
jgi:hypothetical protein